MRKPKPKPKDHGGIGLNNDGALDVVAPGDLARRIAELNDARGTRSVPAWGGGSFLERVGKRDGKMPTADRIASAGKCPVQVKGAPLF